MQPSDDLYGLMDLANRPRAEANDVSFARALIRFALPAGLVLWTMLIVALIRWIV